MGRAAGGKPGAGVSRGGLRLRWPPHGNNGGGSVRGTVDFVKPKKVVVRGFTVRDICPGLDAYLCTREP